ncbi:hypothetical protein [Cetobacterium sp.]|uniref:hypothetical protein n=1 Tax=Cetobacterium sp. TaxID=2071632 RepID=UPI003F3C8C42
MSIPKTDYNNIMARLRIARDKYYAGYAVGADLASGTVITAKQLNDANVWCNAVTVKSPLSKTYTNVTVGNFLKNTELSETYKQINEVSVCYNNCYCDCDCDHSGHGCSDGR